MDVWNHPRPPNCETVFCEERAWSGPSSEWEELPGPPLALGPELPDPSGEQGEPRGAGRVEGQVPPRDTGVSGASGLPQAMGTSRGARGRGGHWKVRPLLWFCLGFRVARGGEDPDSENTHLCTHSSICVSNRGPSPKPSDGVVINLNHKWETLTLGSEG